MPPIWSPGMVRGSVQKLTFMFFLQFVTNKWVCCEVWFSKCPFTNKYFLFCNSLLIYLSAGYDSWSACFLKKKLCCDCLFGVHSLAKRMVISLHYKWLFNSVLSQAYFKHCVTSLLPGWIFLSGLLLILNHINLLLFCHPPSLILICFLHPTIVVVIIHF
jgi:hypothetical protein